VGIVLNLEYAGRFRNHGLILRRGYAS